MVTSPLAKTCFFKIATNKPSKTDIFDWFLWALRLQSTQLRGLGSDPFSEPERENRWLKAGKLGRYAPSLWPFQWEKS